MREILASSELFGGLSSEHLDEIEKIAVIKQYGRGESIFFEGDPGTGFYMVATGRVKIFKTSISGKEQILHIFGPGEPFGEVPVFHGQPFPANATALEKTSLIFFSRQAFVDIVHTMPSLVMNMLAVLSMRLRRFTTQIENLSLKEVPARLAGYLLYVAEEQGNVKQVELQISKGQLASLLGTIPETLSRIFAKMSEEGLISVDGKMISLLDLEGLEQKE
ncbi:cAMP-binding protein [Desulfocapsa sulfexigens DSM 10523]|uniref:cAMP-binding protein n=1 Tax=Desulfocapsa sulfexigens (strain DSM 10523 / SB164P1) TaxID=1167006 RepID=M1PGX2_DESSD|nr:Crp/Fnr family transcriptional regulator [Desulfocapsa sulfexigens]AGF78880.1 cAMP-binding protein [Desulfocapsa sulfexigens DSM 10523]